MVSSIIAFGRKHIQTSRKREFFTKKDIEAAVKHLDGLRKGGSSGGGSKRATGGGVPGTSISEEVCKSLLLVNGSKGPVLCRIKTKADKAFLRPVVPLEELEMVFKEHDIALGHGGYETLYAMVSFTGPHLHAVCPTSLSCMPLATVAKPSFPLISATKCCTFFAAVYQGGDTTGPGSATQGHLPARPGWLHP